MGYAIPLTISSYLQFAPHDPLRKSGPSVRLFIRVTYLAYLPPLRIFSIARQ